METTDPESETPKPRPRRRLVLWISCLLALSLVGVFCQFLLRPYLEVRAASDALSLDPSEKSAPVSIGRMGGPEAAARKLNFYLHLPEWLAPLPSKADAIFLLGFCRPGGLEPLVAVLKRADADLSPGAAVGLGLLGDPRAVQPLIATLKSEDEDLRECAAEALGYIGPPARKAVPALRELVQDETPLVRQAAQDALEKIRSAGDEEDHPPEGPKHPQSGKLALLSKEPIASETGAGKSRPEEPVGGDKLPAPEVTTLPRGQATEPAGTEIQQEDQPRYLAVTPRTSSTYMTFERLRHEGLRVYRLGKTRSIDTPRRLLFRPLRVDRLIETVIRKENARYPPKIDLNVTWLREGSTALIYAGASDETVKRVLDGLGAKVAKARLTAAREAKNVGDPRIIAALVQAASGDDREVSRAARHSLRELGMPAVVVLIGEAACQLAREDLKSRDEATRRSGVGALVTFEHDEAMALMAKALGDKNHWVRMVAARILGDFTSEEAATLLGKALRDRERSVRDEATWALGRNASAAAVLILEKCLTSKDPHIRYRAAHALRRVPDPRVVSLLERVLHDKEKSSADLGNRVCNAAIGSLRDFRSLKALDLLAQLQADPDHLIRYRVIDALSEHARPPTDQHGQRAMALYAGLLADEHSGVRIYAASTVSSLATPEARDLVIARLKVETDESVRAKLVENLTYKYRNDPAAKDALKAFREAPKDSK
jgi:HEAT repeat protein